MSIMLLLTYFVAPVWVPAQTAVTTWHYNNARTSANTTELRLSPTNVNAPNFGKLFSQPVDGMVVGHPLYLPGLDIPGQGVHNVVYVATMHDTVYAFDADNANAGPLWMTSIFDYSPPGATTVPATVKKNGGTTGWTEVGIISTPVIDQSAGTLYLVAETYENGQVVHRLHALDVATGQEKLGGPTTIAAIYTLSGTTSTFSDLYQMNRPALLLANGHIYIGFGSNCCNNYSQGWVMSYNAATLQQEGAFDVEPGKTLASIWQQGAGLSADSDGFIYAETSEGFYAERTNLSESVLKLSQSGTGLAVTDWFTPFNHQNLSANDQDMAESVTVLPDHSGPFPQELIAVGKQGTVYVLNRANMGQLCGGCTTTDTQIVQELYNAVGFESGSPVYWNNMVYFNGASRPVMAFALDNNGLLTTPPAVKSTKLHNGKHAVITANGLTNGIFWFTDSNNTLVALDAVTLNPLYSSGQAANGRDQLAPLAHFATPIVADGKVFIGTQNGLAVYGLFPALSLVGGNGQSANVSSTLANSLTVQAVDPYSTNVFPGVTVTFSDGGKGGTFNPATAVTDAQGRASTSYTLPKLAGTYSVTASAPGYAPGSFTETAVHGSASQLIRWAGYSQSAPVNKALPAPLIAKAADSDGNGVPGINVVYSGGAAGALSANSVVTDSKGMAPVNYTTSTTAGTVRIFASSSGLNSLTFYETVKSGPAAAMTVKSGNGQNAPPNTRLPQPLAVKVSDQYGNAVVGVSVTFSDGGAGGTFSSIPVTSASGGIASVSYTTPASAGTISIQATATGVSAPGTFTVNGQ
ncbi:MAG: Ig-like domain-containing protein [Acidobacteria bacterium]|nr:Ig-like domain-containing protein [Acidobacteriota bacterium]